MSRTWEEASKQNSTPLYAVGDVHGERRELDRMLDLIAAHGAERGILRPEVVMLGDYVDRGPDSRGVVDRLIRSDTRRDFDLVCLVGNHDIAVLAVLRGATPVDWLANGGLACMQSYGVAAPHADGGDAAAALDAFRRAVPPEHAAFLRSLKTWYRRGSWLFTHAGIDPLKPLSAHKAADLVHGTPRFLTWRTHFEDRLRVVHGHFGIDAVEIHAHRVAVDTRCGMGGSLSAVVIDGDRVEPFAAPTEMTTP